MPAEIVDLTNCDREPIHIPGSIQGHGAMLVCDPGDLRLLFASENLTSVTGLPSGGHQGTALTELLGAGLAHDIRNAAAKVGGPGVPGVLLGVALPDARGPFDVFVHSHEGRMIVEIEVSADGGRSAQNALDLTQTLIRRIGLETDVAGVATAGARLMRAMLGYDRVMVYRFLHNGAGRVIAEAKAGALHSFLGQHFPASDIPRQARRLYLVNSIRMIADVNYAPVPLRPDLDEDEPPVDMSFAQLRSVSPIHCEYLRNMGVSGSLSISIIVNDELWGLISCHHDTPRIVPAALRIGAELFGQYFSLQLAAADHRAELLASTRAREGLDNIIARMSTDDAVFPALRERLPDFTALLACDGAGILTSDGWTFVGSAPGRDDIQALTEHIAERAPSGVWTTQSLRDLGMANGSAVAGVMAIPLSFVPGDYLFYFRNEEAHDIEWAGEPVKVTTNSPSGVRLTPRGSFETWREEVRGRSTPWTTSDLSVADAICTYLRNIVLRQKEITEEERSRIDRRRRILNDEMNHRVKNIITLVKSIATQSGARASSVTEYAAALEGRLNALAFAHDHSLRGAGGGTLLMLIEAEAALHRYGAQPGRVTATGPNIMLDEQSFGGLALVVHEMMTNAAKYGALSVPEGQLNILWSILHNGDCEIVWMETGGPPVNVSPREGFGTQLVRTTMEYDLRGTAEVTYDAAGIRARFMVPAAHQRLTNAPSEASGPCEAPAGQALAGLAVLIVEDQGLIAMDTADTLRQMGARDVRSEPDVATARQQLLDFTPDFAILDVNLGGESSEAIAEILAERAIPFVFATGYGDNTMIAPRFHNVAVLRKPLAAAEIAVEVSRVKEK